MTWWQSALGLVFVAAVTGVTGIIVARINRKPHAHEAAPYADMSARLSKVEADNDEMREDIATMRQQNERLERENHVMLRSLSHVVDWIDDGAKPPPPDIDPAARDLLKTQRTTTD